VRINEELLERKVAAPVQKTEINDRRRSASLPTRHPSIHKSWHYISSTSGGHQSVLFARGLRATEFVLFVVLLCIGLHLLYNPLKLEFNLHNMHLVNTPQETLWLMFFERDREGRSFHYHTKFY
jgi:hypothetical protein